MNEIGSILIKLCIFSLRIHQGKKKKYAVGHWTMPLSCVSCEHKNKKHKIYIFYIMSWEWNVSVTRKYSSEYTTFSNLENTGLKKLYILFLYKLRHFDAFWDIWPRASFFIGCFVTQNIQIQVESTAKIPL